MICCTKVAIGLDYEEDTFLIRVPNLIKVWSSMLVLSTFLSIGFCSFRWDILTGNLELVEQIDGHSNIVYDLVHSKKQ
jgi:hypothetical protein